MPTGGAKTTRIVNGAVVDWPFEPWMWTAKLILDRREERDGVVAIKQEEGKAAADKKEKGVAVAKLARDACAATGAQADELRRKLAAARRELERGAAPAAHVSAAAADDDEGGEEAEEGEGEAGGSGGGTETRTGKQRKSVSTTAVLGDVLTTMKDLTGIVERSLAAQATENAQQRAHEEKMAQMKYDADAKKQAADAEAAAAAAKASSESMQAMLAMALRMRDGRERTSE